MKKITKAGIAVAAVAAVATSAMVISAFAFTAILIPPAVQCKSPYSQYLQRRCSVSGR